MKGSPPSRLTSATIAAATWGREAMPRLPQVMATLAPGWKRPSRPTRSSSALVAAAMSATSGVVKLWRTFITRGSANLAISAVIGERG